MRSFQSRREQSRLFVSVKCIRAIPVASPTARDYLIQSTLDPSITAIDFATRATIDGRLVRLDGVVVERDGIRSLVDMPDGRRVRDVDEAGMRLLAAEELGLQVLSVSLDDVRSAPRLNNAREIWSHRAASVSFAEREEILGALQETGAMPLGRLDGRVTVRGPILTAVSALACEALVDIDIAAPLDRFSLVTIGKASRSMARNPPMRSSNF